MSQHTQWVPVSAEGAEQQPGFRCDGCGQVRWQAEKPKDPCDICPLDGPGGSAFMGAFIAAKMGVTPGSDAPPADRDPAPSPTIEEPPSVTAALNDLLPSKRAEERRPRSRNPGLTKETE